jgi:hypothetical protein
VSMLPSAPLSPAWMGAIMPDYQIPVTFYVHDDGVSGLDAEDAADEVRAWLKEAWRLARSRQFHWLAAPGVFDSDVAGADAVTETED